MSAQLWSSGPAHLGVGFGSGFGGVSSSLSYLGTAERAPHMTIMPEYIGLGNDLGGHVIPFDTAYSGKHAVISCMLTRWDEAVLTAIMANDESGQGVGGVDQRGDIGSLMLQENFAMTVTVQFPYQAITSYTNMPPGYRFWACVLESPVSFDTIGTEGRKMLINFHAYRVYNASDGSLTLYDSPSGVYPTPT